MPAGPSELLAIADQDGNPDYLASDLLAQAEHGPDSHLLFITNSESIVAAVKKAIDEQLPKLSRNKIAEQSIARGTIIIVDSIKEAIEISNRYAPEHLILQVEDADNYVNSITSAGAVFLGKWATESLGDYVTGSNHVLPTSGAARSYSGLSINDFIRYVSFQAVTSEGLAKIGRAAADIAEIEGLTAHKAAVCLRLNSLEVQYE